MAMRGQERAWVAAWWLTMAACTALARTVSRRMATRWAGSAAWDIGWRATPWPCTALGMIASALLVQLVAYRINKLTPDEFEQTRVPLSFGQSRQGPAAWNGVRHHHLDVHQVRSWL